MDRGIGSTMKRTKALYLSYDGILEPLGQSQILPYLKELSKKGISFILLTYEKKRYLQDKKMLAMISRELTDHNIKWFKLRYHKNPPFFSTLFDGLRGLILSIFILIKEKIIIIHARSYVSTLIAFIIKKVFGTKFIFDMRGFWADEKLDGGVWKEKDLLYRLVKILEKRYLISADRIVVLSEKARDYIADNFELRANVVVIPCAADAEKFKFNSHAHQALRKRYFIEEKFVFVHAGSLEGWYLIDRMLDFFGVAKEIIDSAHFLILTHSPREMLDKMIAAKNLRPEDFTVAAVAQSEMPDYLSLADVGLFFLKRSFAMKAVLPTKVAEYLSCGIPIITNRGIGDLEECILNNNAGIIIDGFAEREYKSALQGALDLVADAKVRENCRRTALDNFSLTGAAEKYNELYSELSNRMCEHMEGQ